MKISLNEEKFEHSVLLEEKRAFKDLSPSEKITYIWDYYKWWILFGALFIILAIVTIPTIIENNKEMVLYTAFLNSNIKGQEETSLMDDYTEAAKIDMDNKRITLDCSNYIDREHPNAAAMQTSQKLTAMLSAKTIDVIVSDSSNFDFYASQGAYYDLKELLPEDLCEKYKDYFVETENPETGELTAYGLNLRDSSILKKEKAFDFEPIISVCITTSQKENAIAFIEYLLDEI